MTSRAVAERTNAPVLKTDDPQAVEGSNPSRSANTQRLGRTPTSALWFQPVIAPWAACPRGARMTDMASAALHHVAIHGHDVTYRKGGDGSAVLLIHGMAGSSRTWKEVTELLVPNHTVIA